MNMSNEQAVQILIPMRNMMCDQYGCPISDAVFAFDKAIEALSADRLQGEWLIGNRPLEGKFRLYRCSVCGYEPFYKGEPITPTNMTLLYCPNCGARMFAKDINAPSKKGVGNDI